MDSFKPLSPLHTYDDPLDVDDSYALFPLLDDVEGTSTWFNDFTPSSDLDFDSQHSQIFCSLCDCLMNIEEKPITRKKSRRHLYVQIVSLVLHPIPRVKIQRQRDLLSARDPRQMVKQAEMESQYN